MFLIFYAFTMRQNACFSWLVCLYCLPDSIELSGWSGCCPSSRIGAHHQITPNGGNIRKAQWHAGGLINSATNKSQYFIANLSPQKLPFKTLLFRLANFNTPTWVTRKRPDTDYDDQDNESPFNKPATARSLLPKGSIFLSIIGYRGESWWTAKSRMLP